MAWILEYQPKVSVPGKGFVAIEPWDWQQIWLQEQSLNRALNKGRQQGASEIEILFAAWELTHVPAAALVNVSQNETVVRRFHRRAINALKSVADRDPHAPDIKTDNAQFFETADGKTMHSVPASPDAGRSYTATHWRLDEANFVPFADDIYQGAEPTTSLTNGRISLFSTPKGRGTFFHQVCENHVDMGFAYHEYPWWWCPPYNPAYDEFYAAFCAGDVEGQKNAIDKAKNGDWYLNKIKKLGKLRFMQEHECNFDANTDSVFSAKTLERLFRRNYLEQIEDELGVAEDLYQKKPVDGHSYVTFFDLGRKQDPTVGVTIDITEKPARLVEYKRIPPRTAEWDMIEQSIRQTKRFYGGSLGIDSTGVGDVMLGMLEDIVDEPLQIQDNSLNRQKYNMIEQVRIAANKGDLILPKIPQLYREFQRYQWQDRKIVQDSVIAVAGAVSMFMDAESVFLGVDKDFSFTQ